MFPNLPRIGLFAVVLTTSVVGVGCDKAAPMGQNGGQVKIPVEPPFRWEPAKVTITRADQLYGAAHRHTVWINDKKAGEIRNGATYTYEFMPKSSGRNEVWIVGYTPIGSDPVSNMVYFHIGSKGELTGTIKWVENGSGLDLRLDLTIAKEGLFPPGYQK